MRENTDGPGTSLYFKLAVIHGGMPPLSRSEYPEYCAHRREAFPGACALAPSAERPLPRSDIARAEAIVSGIVFETAEPSA